MSRDDTYYMRGIAALMVMLAHYTDGLARQGVNIGILYPFSRLGPLGVGIFFFVSGYGLSKSSRPLDYKYLIRRLEAVLFPFWTSQIVLYCIDFILLDMSFSWVTLCKRLSIIRAPWFVSAILFLYLLYWVIYKYSKKNQLIILCLAVMSVAVLMFSSGVQEFRYAAQICFPFGVVFAAYEKEIVQRLQKQYWILSIGICSIFTGSILVYDLWDNRASVLGKDIAACSIALAITVVMFKLQLNSKLLKWAGRMSLYIYLVHPKVIEWFAGMTMTKRTVLLFIITFVVTGEIYFIYQSMEKWGKEIYRGVRRGL